MLPETILKRHVKTKRDQYKKEMEREERVELLARLKRAVSAKVSDFVNSPLGHDGIFPDMLNGAVFFADVFSILTCFCGNGDFASLDLLIANIENNTMDGGIASRHLSTRVRAEIGHARRHGSMESLESCKIRVNAFFTHLQEAVMNLASWDDVAELDTCFFDPEF